VVTADKVPFCLMLGPSHAAIGAASAVVTAHVLGVEAVLARSIHGPSALVTVATVAIVAPVGAIAALLPDLDEPDSELGHLLPRWWHRLTPGHRRSTHSLLAVAVVGFLAHLALGALGVGGFPLDLMTALVAVGMLSHLAADGITDHGVPLLWPWRQHFGLPLFRTGSAVEHLVVLLVLAGTGWWALGLDNLVRAARGGTA
jgi:inner membrane protein